MKKKVAKCIIVLLLVIVFIVIIVGAYYKIVDIETEEPKEIEDDCEISIPEYAGRKVFIVKPKNQIESACTILYMHGGSYVAEVTKEHWEFIRKIAVDTNSTVIVPDYPLTPKYTYKDVFRMIEPLYKEIIEKVDSNNLIVMGDSAGGGLSLALMEKISEEGLNIPKKIVLISPWVDVRLNNSKIEEVQKNDKELNKEILKLAGIAYAGEDGINSYLVNPIDGDLSMLKNITIFTGTNDILNPDVHLLQEKAKEQDTAIDIKEYESAGHIWFIENNSSQELVQQGYEDVLKLINEEEN